MLAVLVMFLVSLGTFTMAHAVPGSPVEVLLGERQAGNPEVRAAVEKRWGFDKPLPVQFVYYYRNLFRGDLGMSVTSRRPVMTDLRQYVPATIELALAAMLYATAVGLPLGLISALRANRWPDHIGRFIALIGTSIPVFWLGLLFLYVFFYRLHWLPGPGQLDIGMQRPERVTGMVTVDSVLAGDWAAFKSALRHLILPAVVLGSYAMGIIARMLRSSLLAALSDDYIRTARAKGIAERKVMTRHALRAAMVPIVSLVGIFTISLIGGSVLTEEVFARPGLGKLLVGVTKQYDYNMVQAIMIVYALIIVIVNIIVDLIYTWVDPRVRYS